MKEYWFTQTIDHFSAQKPRGSRDGTFQQRVLYDDTHFDAESGVILHYLGNEGDIYMFANTDTILRYWAPRLKALVLFVESRYYGESMPFGAASLDFGNNGFLTMEQIIADNAVALAALREQRGIQATPAIACGGSLGGELAAFARIKYPHVWIGAFAASAPVYQFVDIPGVDTGSFYAIITKDYTEASPVCADVIRTAFLALEPLGATAEGRAATARALRLCAPDTADNVYYYLDNAITFMAMSDYSAPSGFMQPLPAYPVQVTCDRIARRAPRNMSDTIAVLEAVGEALQVYLNYTGEQPACFNMSLGSAPGLGALAWDFQTCTEMVIPVPTDGVHDFFLPAPWNYTQYAQQCQAQFGVTPRPHWMPLWSGAPEFPGATNIVFSNGGRDPWSGDGVLKSLSPTVVAVFIPDTAHHADLLWPQDSDPPDLVAARKIELEHIERWIREARA